MRLNERSDETCCPEYADSEDRDPEKNQEYLHLEEHNHLMKDLKEAAQFALMTLDHAMFLGHLGEGSTRGMAQDAVNKLKKAGIVNPGDDNELG